MASTARRYGGFRERANGNKTRAEARGWAFYLSSSVSITWATQARSFEVRARYLVKFMKEGYKLGYQIVISLILAGAVGNIIDCVCYGVIFSESTYFATAQFMPEVGYASWFMGKVVDMFYFPLFTFPDWVPLLGGEIFFSPIFNLADSYITVAIFVLIIFYHKDFNDTIERYTTKDTRK